MVTLHQTTRSSPVRRRAAGALTILLHDINIFCSIVV